MSFNITRVLAGAVLLLSFTQTAHAGPYGTLGFSIEDIQPEDDFESFSGTGINARLGYDFGRYFGLEAEGQVGLSGEGDNPNVSQGVLVQNETYDYKGELGLFLRPKMPVSDNFSLSLRAGVGVRFFDRTVDNPDLPRTDSAFEINDKSSLGYGALGTGVEYSFGERKTDSVRLDYLRRFHVGSLSDGDDEPFQDNKFTVSYSRKF